MTETKNRWLKSSTLGAAALLGIVLAGMVNYLGWKYYKRFDWTQEEIYSLSERSDNLLRSLDRKIEAVVFMSPVEPLYDAVRELLSRYDAASPNFTVKYIDAEKNLLEAQRLVDDYQLQSLNVVVLDDGDDRRIIESADLADYDYSGMQMGQAPEMIGFKGEQTFTGGILELVEDTKSKVLFTAGHGELPLDDFSGRGLSQVRDLLVQDNFDVEEWASLGRPEVPENTALVVIAGPTAGFLQPEVAVLERYLAADGRLLLLTDPLLDSPAGDRTTGLEELLQAYGVTIGEDIVIDPANPLPFYGAETIFANRYGSHGITRSLDQTQLPVILPLARSVRIADAEETPYEVTELVLTTADGWGERDLENLTRVEQGDEDLQGPVALAVAVAAFADDEAPEPQEPDAGDEAPVEESASEPGTRLVVVGDSDFASNAQLANVGNAELLVNSVNWLVERETLVGISAKKPEQVRLSLSRAQVRNIAWTVFGLLPGLAILMGTAVFYHRRR